MPVEPYETKVVDGESYWVIPCLVPKESDPERGAFIFFAKPLDGITGIGGLIKGDPGKHTIVDTVIDRTVLEYDDPTPDFMEFVETVPGSDTTSQVVQLRASQRKGPPGDDGDTVLTPSDYGTPEVGQTLAVKAGLSEFELVTPKVGGMHWPGSLSNAPAGTTATYTIGTIAIAAGTYKNAVRPHIEAAVTVTGSTSDIAVDLVARLNAVDGPVVGRGVGVAGVQTQRVVITSGPDAGAADSTNKIAAGAGATIYLVTEKQSGSATYLTSSPRYCMEMVQVP